MGSDSQPNFEPQYGRLLEAYGSALRRLCAAYTRDPSERQDLFQDVAMALWTALPRFRAAASERTWLYRIAHNVAVTHMRQRWRRDSFEQPLDDAASEAVFDADHRRLALIELVRRLNPVDRQLALLYLEGLSAWEMEEVTGMTANNVAVRLSRLRRKLSDLQNSKEAQG